MTTDALIEAINAYADIQQHSASDRDWLALVHRRSRGPAANHARQLREAGMDALDVIQDWPTLEKREQGACVLQAPDGTQVLYYCERHAGRSLERLARL